jgi:hypothetical protein
MPQRLVSRLTNVVCPRHWDQSAHGAAGPGEIVMVITAFEPNEQLSSRLYGSLHIMHASAS